MPFLYCSAPHGKAVGERVGEAVGELVGRLVGAAVGGDVVGESDGEAVGDRDGDCVGSEVVGEKVGDIVGEPVGKMVGDLVKVGDDDGNHVLFGVQFKRTTPAWYWDAAQGHASKVSLPMLVTASGIVMLARLVQP